MRGTKRERALPGHSIFQRRCLARSALANGVRMFSASTLPAMVEIVTEENAKKVSRALRYRSPTSAFSKQQENAGSVVQPGRAREP